MQEAGAPYELSTLPFPPREAARDYLEVNPIGTVPYVTDGDVVMNESAAVLEYIAAKFGAGVLGVGPDDPAFGSWLNWLHFGEAALAWPLALILRFSMFEPEDRRQPYVVAEYTRFFLERVALVDKTVAQQEFLCANRFTVADISVGYALFLSHRMGLGTQHPPAVAAYLKRLQARPAFQAARAKQRPQAKETITS